MSLSWRLDHTPEGAELYKFAQARRDLCRTFDDDPLKSYEQWEADWTAYQEAEKEMHSSFPFTASFYLLHIWEIIDRDKITLPEASA